MSYLAPIVVSAKEGLDQLIEHNWHNSPVQHTPPPAQGMVAQAAAGEGLVEHFGSEAFPGTFDRSLSQASDTSSSGTSFFTGSSGSDGTFSRSVSKDFGDLPPSRSGKLALASQEEMWRIFQSVDEDKDGRVCLKELGAFLAKLESSLTEKDIQGLLDSADENGDRRLEFHEFVKLYHSVASVEERNGHGLEDVMEVDEDPDEQALRDAFAVFDRNNDGLISPSELLLVMRSLSSTGNSKKLSDCSRMIKAVDKDGDGQVNFQEFKEMMTTGFL